MKFISTVSKSCEAENIETDLVTDNGQAFDMAVLFITPKSRQELRSVITKIRRKIQVKNFLACTCAGIIGSNEEIEDFSGASLLCAQMPGVEISPFFIDQKQLSGFEKEEDWYDFLNVYPNENPVFLIFPDPFQLDLEKLITGMNNAFPKCSVIGGLASGSSSPNGNLLTLNDQEYSEGAMGLVLKGDVQVDTIVSQGCRPIGKSYIVTKAEHNVIYELGGKKFIDVIQETFKDAPDEDRQLAQQALFVGIVMDEYKHEFKRGDFLIRACLGIDPESGAGVIADRIEAGQTVQIHLRDAKAATEDLNSMLKAYKNQQSRSPQGAFVFSCNGRGQHLFEEPDHDIKIIQSHIGPVPAAGFFCAGEIGPVGGKNFLHGFTDSIALFHSTT